MPVSQWQATENLHFNWQVDVRTHGKFGNFLNIQPTGRIVPAVLVLTVSHPQGIPDFPIGGQLGPRFPFPGRIGKRPAGGDFPIPDSGRLTWTVQFQ